MMHSKNILIADDDRDLVELLAHRCRSLGLAVDTAHDAMTALRIADQNQPDLVLLDVNMPAGNGLGVREMMADNARLAAIPVIILTGQSDEDTIRRCHLTCAYYVPKCPDVWPRIEPLIRELLDPDDAGGPRQAPAGSTDTVPAGDFEVARKPVMELRNAQPAPPADPAPPRDGPWVLCIDDDSELSFTLMHRLEQRGINVLRAFAGMEGYRYACVTPAQAIILDYEMDDGNGDYVLRRLKEGRLTQNIPVIVLTGRKDRALQRKMYNLGAIEYLTKPCDWERLWAALDRCFERCATPRHSWEPRREKVAGGHPMAAV